MKRYSNIKKKHKILSKMNESNIKIVLFIYLFQHV